jgi:Ca2+-binding EF-hand superfamily protein
VRLKVFAGLDANKDNIVSREEYVRCLASTSAFMIAGVAGLGGRPDEMGLLNRTEARFTSIDTSNDKKISWGEYMKAAQEDYRRFGRMSGRTEQGASAAAGWAFARMDNDLSGEIEIKEWTADAGLSGMADRSFQAMDADKDGRIGQDEYQAVVDKASMPAK